MFVFETAFNRFQVDFDALRDEAHTLPGLLEKYRLSENNLPFLYAHHGYLMNCMSKVDQYSKFWQGPGKDNQTQRMIDFLARYVYPLRQFDRIHSVVVQMFRHSLMHTGGMRVVYERDEGVVYTWRIQFGRLPDGLDHYSLTEAGPEYKGWLTRLRLPADSKVTAIRAVNISIPLFVDNLYQGVSRYMIDLRNSAEMQKNYEGSEAEIAVQAFSLRLPTPSPTP